MRPINKGTIPLDMESKPIQLEFYQQSRGHLITRLGAYCSYCERYLGGNIAVEHIQPKSKNPQLELDWGNLLIACNNCNSIKGDKPVNLSDFLWPDKDNTSIAFIYISGGLITTPPNLTQNILRLAKNTIELTGLDRIPSEDPNINPEMKDRRWSERRTALLRAERANTNLIMTNTESMRNQIVDTAIATGFFSIWMTVFQHDSDMLQRFIHAFPGTSEECFDSKCAPVNRPNGNI